ncbi:hypothetical protein U8C44_11360 (plasmid) [Sinorhizobium meliloti]|nr:hypothetical protein U8C44_11360 [Sinorhizobium meliloti]
MKVVGDERDDAVEYRMTRTRQVEAEALGGNEEKQEPGQQAPGHLRVHGSISVLRGSYRHIGGCSEASLNNIP